MDAELIARVRSIAEHGADWRINLVLNDAADALEADEKRIAELEAQLPKEGEWHGGQYDFYCSQCGVYQNYYTGKTNYCPNCGARMKGEQE